MYSQSRGQRSYDIPSLPMSMLKQKYQQTYDVYDDPLTVENFMKETLRYTGCDAPLYEEDLPRASRNPLSQTILNVQEYGGRYTHAPFHPELFLGDMTKDQRKSSTMPLTAQMADQHTFRHERYIKGKFQDVGDVRTEGLVGTKRMLRQVRQGHNNTATRMGGIFDDSINTMVARSNPNPGNSTHKVGDTIQDDQNMYEVNGEKILPKYGTDIVGKLSNMVGVQWEVQPDAKYGLSSVSNVYRSKQEVDQAANAVFRLGQQDTLFKNEKTDIKTPTTVQQMGTAKAARALAQSVEVKPTGTSMKNRFAMRMLPPPAPTNHVDMFVGTQSTKDQIQSVGIHNRNTGGQKHTESLVEPLTSNSMMNVSRPMTLPEKDQLAIHYKIRRTQQQSTARNEDQDVGRSIGVKNLSNAFVKRSDALHDIIKRADQQSAKYANSIPVKSIDNVSNVRMTTSKFTSIKEEAMANPTGSNTQPTGPSLKDFEFDTDPTMNNSYLNRRGLNQRMTRLSSKQEYDNEVSPLNDGITPFRTNYNKT